MICKPLPPSLVRWPLAALALTTSAAFSAEEFSKFEPFIEINASDGDVGFHVLVDVEDWETVKLYDSDGDIMFRARARDDFAEQGLTELFMESSEPPCWFDEEDPEADESKVVSLEEFLERFEAGTYKAKGRTIDNRRLLSFAEFTHEIPAAPLTGVEINGTAVTIHWEQGDDIGACDFPANITPPGEVEVARWEVAVVVNTDELPGGQLPPGVPDSAFSVMLPAHVTSVQVPQEYLDAYLEVGVTQFKIEVGAKEAGGNQTYSEDEFEVDI